jgi:hypothetical protein
MLRRVFKYIKQAFVLQALFLIFLAPTTVHALSGYLFAENDFFGQAWERTIQGRWHYDTGPGIGLRVEASELSWLLYGEISAVPENKSKGYAGGIGMGVVGQRSKIGARVGYDNLNFEAAYELRSWFATGAEYGPQYMVDRSDVVQSLTVRVNVRVF